MCDAIYDTESQLDACPHLTALEEVARLRMLIAELK
jgi:hypothetical protein